MIPPKEIIYSDSNRLVNISHSLGYFVFAPPKTGSMTSSRVFGNFDFQTFKISDTNNIKLFSTKFIHSHYYNSLPNYENYKLICTVRNPYSKFVSLFNKREDNKNKEHVLTKGSAILYDFFNTAIANPYLVYGGAGAGMGKGTGVYLGKTFVEDATRLSNSNNYELSAVIEYQKSKYIIKGEK